MPCPSPPRGATRLYHEAPPLGATWPHHVVPSLVPATWHRLAAPPRVLSWDSDAPRAPSQNAVNNSFMFSRECVSGGEGFILGKAPRAWYAYQSKDRVCPETGWSTQEHGKEPVRPWRPRVDY